ncbi:AAA family ATPase [Streptomyces litchfieldiae]|uniref:AAA family ATPase n=1 Tax=Streptomyces litchfieldiae TaxID=3075543 RepID=A0ABU2N0Z5_9ACTN|nr:AAA family ATPase [Streptomyces sp. DSM 44938]MDT0347554.1 AAA family ATPase [Streptomyces sp. DSM 44938]
MATEDPTVSRDRAGWRPERLREQREAHGLTLEEAGERLRAVAEQARLKGIPAANPQTLWQHEQGEVFPGPHYRRAYCLLYRATEPQLGFRNPLPGEESQFILTPLPEQRNGQHVLAVERALMRIAPGTDEVDHLGMQQRVMDAWKRRHTGGDPHRPVVVLVGGYAGSGKTEFARFLTQLTGWPLLDKDPLTRPLVEALLEALGSDAHDRHTETYRTQVRPVEYASLMAAVHANIACQISTVVTAPFLAELSDAGWMQRLTHRCAAAGVDVAPIWVQCDPDSMHEYISHRGAARDAWKLARWDEYLATVDAELRPAVPHLVVDNRMGAAISLADQARLALGAVAA